VLVVLSQLKGDKCLNESFGVLGVAHQSFGKMAIESVRVLVTQVIKEDHMWKIEKKEDCEKVVTNLEITKEEENKLRKQLDENWRKGDTVYLFMDEQSILDCTVLRKFDKDRLIQILRKPKEVGAVIHINPEVDRLRQQLFFTVSRYGH